MYLLHTVPAQQRRIVFLLYLAHSLSASRIKLPLVPDILDLDDKAGLAILTPY